MKKKLSKQLEQEQNQRKRHHREGFQWEGGKVQEIGRKIGSHKVDREG